jgi:hypothetical protein
MSLINWSSRKIKRLDLIDMVLIKIAIIGFVLMLAKLWPTILNLSWYWYLLIFILAAIVPYYKILKK